MRVFVVYALNGSGWVVRDVFDTQEKAEAYRKHLTDEGLEATTKVEVWEVK